MTKHFQQMSNALAARQAELVEALKQKDVLLKEVNHRVKNSLQLVASLFGLQRLRISDPQLRRHFEEAMQRVTTIARVHQRLYQDDRVSSLRFDEFLTEMCEELNQALGSSNGPRLECRATECRLETDQAIPLALIVNELVTNAFKYAYPDRRAGAVRVECSPRDGEIVLVVSDDGVPLPSTFDPAKGDGLGMRMITGLATQLRGKVEIQARAPGKAFVIHVPISGAADA